MFLISVAFRFGTDQLVLPIIVSSAVPRPIFMLLNQYGHPKNEPKFLKTSPIFLTLTSLIAVDFSYLIILG